VHAVDADEKDTLDGAVTVIAILIAVVVEVLGKDAGRAGGRESKKSKSSFHGGDPLAIRNSAAWLLEDENFIKEKVLEDRL
jgi:hypothetical protein